MLQGLEPTNSHLSQPGAVELPPSQTRDSVLPPQPKAVDLSSSEPGTNELPRSSDTAADHHHLDDDPHHELHHDPHNDTPVICRYLSSFR